MNKRLLKQSIIGLTLSCLLMGCNQTAEEEQIEQDKISHIKISEEDLIVPESNQVSENEINKNYIVDNYLKLDEIIELDDNHIFCFKSDDQTYYVLSNNNELPSKLSSIKNNSYFKVVGEDVSETILPTIAGTLEELGYADFKSIQIDDYPIGHFKEPGNIYITTDLESETIETGVDPNQDLQIYTQVDDTWTKIIYNQNDAYVLNNAITVNEIRYSYNTKLYLLNQIDIYDANNQYLETY